MTFKEGFWRWYWGGWISIALYFTVWDVAFYHEGLVTALPRSVIQKVFLGFLSLLVLRAARRQPLEGLEWRQWRIWSFQLFLCFLVASVGLSVNSLVQALVDTLFKGSVLVPRQVLKNIPYFLSGNFHWILLLEICLVGITHVIALQERLRRKDVLAARLETSLSEARHMALRMQLQPHFLFNTLNSISSLVHTDPESADRMIGRLGAFLRMTLDRAPEAFQSLRQELEFIEAYLAIERVRFRERLKVNLNVPEALMEVQVPSFVLQPLVENALKHGLSGKREGGRLEIDAAIEDESFVLRVIDDGPGFVEGREGTGLSNIRSRLALLRASLEISSSPSGGARISLRLPAAGGAP